MSAKTNVTDRSRARSVRANKNVISQMEAALTAVRPSVLAASVASMQSVRRCLANELAFLDAAIDSKRARLAAAQEVAK